MATYVKFEQAPELTKKVLDALELARSSGKVRVGVNEVTKNVERGRAKLVVLAEDVDPPEILIHLPIICKEKNIPFAYCKTRDELGKATGLNVTTSSAVVIESGKASKSIDELAPELIKLAA